MAGNASENPRLESAVTILFGSRIALPILLSGALLVLGLFAFLSWIGRKVTSYRPIGIEELAEEAERKKESGGGSGKNKKTKKQLKAEEEEEANKTYPRKLALLLPINLLAFTYFADGAATIIDGVLLNHGHVDTVDLSLILAPLALYGIVSFFLITATRPEITEHALLKIYAGASLVQAPIALTALSVMLAQVRLFDPLHVFYLCTSSFRVIFAGCLVLAYHPKFRASPTVNTEAAADEHTPLLAAAAHVNGQNGSAGKPEDGTAGKQDAEEEEEEEEDEKPKIRKYDVTAVALRIKRLLPFVAPLRSNLVRGLVVVCIILSLLQNATKILLPRQLGVIVQDLSEGRTPWKE